jgi:hypothetical protein
LSPIHIMAHKNILQLDAPAVFIDLSNLALRV